MYTTYLLLLNVNVKEVIRKIDRKRDSLTLFPMQLKKIANGALVATLPILVFGFNVYISI